jgi:hypothetical protein
MDSERDARVAEELSRMVESTVPSEDEVKALLDKARDPAYWRALNPDLSIGDSFAADALEERPIEDDELDELADYFDEDGYFQIDSHLAPDVLGRMRACVDVLRHERWPLVFAFVYDEFWLVFRTPSLVRYMSEILGPGYRLIPTTWTYYVEDDKGATGWPPHVDNSCEPNRVNVWVPLTDATVQNGCIYVIPQSLAPEGFPEAFWERDTFSHAELITLLQASRAIPARVGSMLGWHSELIHWGSTSGGTGDPRISVAMQFIAADEPPNPGEVPLFDAHESMPTLEERLSAIGRALRIYHKFEPATVRFLGLADLLVENE